MSTASEHVVTLPDGSTRTVAAGTTYAELAAQIGRGLGKAALVAKIDGATLVDLGREIDRDGPVEFCTFDSPEGAEAFRHSSAHLMALAIHEMFPESKFGVGPAITDGFYYDIDRPDGLAEEDLEKLERTMNDLVKAKHRFDRQVMSRDEALAHFRAIGDQYKVELLDAIPEDEAVTFYTVGSFIDLCRGPHVPHTGVIKAFKLTSLAGAYWRGDERNAMLTRVYGTSFPKKALLDEHLARLEEAKKRDHRRIGKDLELFSFHKEGPGFPFFHPNGVVVWNALIDFARALNAAAGYEEIRTPLILNEELWHRSGHWDHYRENMYFTEIDEQMYAVRPMNCPGGNLLYGERPHSYRELPLRRAEFGVVHRHEMSGVLHGLFRVRMFTQDDAHIFCAVEQLTDEIVGVMDLTDRLYSTFNFTYHMELSTRPEKSIGSDALWEAAEDALRAALERRGATYRVNEGDGAFYGPKIDYHIEDCLGRTWQCGTIQVDFSMPERFDMRYVGADNARHRPVMIHRAVCGSMERFLGILIEHCAGMFPTWLAPVQAIVLPVGAKFLAYAESVAVQARAAGLRVRVDDRDEKLGAKISRARLQKIPYMLVVGEQEQTAGTVAVRYRGTQQIGTWPTPEWCGAVAGAVAERRFEDGLPAADG